ncbi:MAG TPA: proton-conducting transporter membrane subunit [Rhodocyclaceae bacterium]|nr:proton-conducting transporter membrane subunit [Rhodocyclaceae bacterium]HRQ46927.1 proton-conducting transporter membrane subunit [Rhodocyclaceae bacterium]
MSDGQILPWVVILPLGAAIVTVLLPHAWRMAASMPAMALQLLAAIVLLRDLVVLGPRTYALADHAAPLGIALLADGPATMMVLLTAVVAGLCCVHAAASLRGLPANGHFWPLAWFLWAALNTIWLSADLFNLYVGLELLGLAAVGLVALRGSAEALAAAMRYLLAALLGSLAYLLGVALLYGAYGTLALPDLQALATPGTTTMVALAFMTLGLLLKTALFPLHAWLPPAHGGALPPVSALLSALVIKASFFILLRLWFALGSDAASLALAWMLGLLGAGAVFWGGWMAWRQTRLKHLVAYSTVAQIGYLFLFFPLAAGAPPHAAALAWDGTMLMLVSHALAKAGMFLAAGNLVLATGGPRIVDLSGISRFRPLSLLGFGLAGVSVMGLPPSGGFTAKWLLLQSALASGQWGWIAVLILGSLLSAAYVFKVFRHSFVEGPKRDHFESPPAVLEISALTLALCAIAIGLVAHAPLAWLRIGMPFGVPG